MLVLWLLILENMRPYAQVPGEKATKFQEKLLSIRADSRIVTIVGADVSPHEFRSPKRTKIGLSPILPLPFRRGEGRGEGSVWSVRHFRSSIVGSTRIVECSRATWRSA